LIIYVIVCKDQREKIQIIDKVYYIIITLDICFLGKRLPQPSKLCHHDLIKIKNIDEDNKLEALMSLYRSPDITKSS